jgi:hypothetical protein
MFKKIEDHPFQKKDNMPHHLCRLYCATCTPASDHACQGPASYAQLTDEKQAAFQAILDIQEGDPEDTFVHSGLLKTRKDAEAFMNYLWPRQNSYPLMFRLLDEILNVFHSRK